MLKRVNFLALLWILCLKLLDRLQYVYACNNNTCFKFIWSFSHGHGISAHRNFELTNLLALVSNQSSIIFHNVKWRENKPSFGLSIVNVSLQLWRQMNNEKRTSKVGSVGSTMACGHTLQLIFSHSAISLILIRDE